MFVPNFHWMNYINLGYAEWVFFKKHFAKLMLSSTIENSDKILRDA